MYRATRNTGRLTRGDFLKVGGGVLVGASVLGLTGCGGGSGSQGGGEFPSGDLTFIAAGSPGGGLDTQARMVEQTIQEEDLIQVGLNIENMGGGGGNPARASLLERPNNGRTLVVESNRVFLSPLTGTTEMTVQDFTPVAKLTTEYLIWATRADSQWESAEQVLDAVQEDPESVTFGVGTVPSDDQFNILRACQEAGVNDITQVNITAFESGGDLATNLLGGNVDVISTGLSEIIEQVEEGEARLLAISAPESQPGAAEGVPTWNELGFDFSLDHWRGVFGPADMPDEAVQWWADTLQQATETETWSDLAQQYRLTSDFEGPDQFSETIEAQRTQAQELIELTGLG